MSDVKKVEGFDVFDEVDTYDHNVESPVTGLPIKDMYVTLRPTTSKEWTKTMQKVLRRRPKGMDPTNIPPERLKSEQIELIAAVTVGFRGFKDAAGKAIKYTPEKMVELLGSNPFRKQLDKVLAKDEVFLVNAERDSD